MKLKAKIERLPESCGVYIMRASSGNILYVGKASSLKKRVSSYFHKNVFTPNKELLVQNIADIDYIACDSEAKALLLECALIKEYKPLYNILLRDDKSFPLVEISKEEYPKVRITRKKKKNNVYFGPYPQAKDLKEALELIRKVFPFRTCVRMPKKECLYYHISLCPAPCTGKITPAAYRKRIKALSLVLEGKRKDVVRYIRKQMAEAVKKLNFEEAAFLRDKLVAVSSLYGAKREFNQVIALKESLNLRKLPLRIEAVDISNIRSLNATGAIVVFENGVPDKNGYRRYKIKQAARDDLGMLKEVIRRRIKRILSKSEERSDLIIIDGGPNQVGVVKAELAGNKLNIPVIGISKKNEEIWFPDKKYSLKLPRSSSALKLVQRVRDESHRFAHKYHLYLRNVSMYGHSKRKKK